MKGLSAVGLLLAVAGCAAESGSNRLAAKEDQVAVALRGRVAGTPLTCVSVRDLRGNRFGAGGAILFEGPGATYYLNRPQDGCPGLDEGMALSTNTRSGRLCEGDVVRLIDTSSGVTQSSCSLGMFVPYSGARSAK